MDNQIKSITDFLYKHRLDFIFAFAIFSIIGFNLYIYFDFKKSTVNDEVVINKKTQENKENNIQELVVDVSGAVVNPGIYVVKKGARVKDVVDLAGGFTYNADKDFFYRNFNLAYPVYDSQKIYVPYKSDIYRGLIQEPKRIFDFTGYSQGVSNITVIPTIASTPSDISVIADKTTEKISINNASKKQLESLPGIGEVTAQKIIDNRPYSSVEELLKKGILRQSVYDQNKDKFSL
ncbi:MAG: DNA-binding protein [Patescibacteria group bacterium]|nr:MAG: DNA-binding protein [Patescibacteria group bacterium]